ncbi:MAG: hypothetical protein ACRCXC_01910 [Legionella sp.]
MFQDKLNTFLTEKTTSFDQVAERMTSAEQELAEVKAEFKASNNRYKRLLDLQEQQLRRLERLDQRFDSSINPEPPQHYKHNLEETGKNGGLLSAFGFMALPQIWPLSHGAPAAEEKETSYKSST